jgi:ribosome recycling factor
MISTPEPRLIRIEPFDPGTLKDIERAINGSNIGLNPAVEGKVIRLPVPELSSERRQQMVKMVKSMAEEARVRVRSARREALELLKKHEKDGEITEDDLRRGEKEVQTITDKKIKEVDEHVMSKEKELTTV